MLVAISRIMFPFLFLNYNFEIDPKTFHQTNGENTNKSLQIPH